MLATAAAHPDLLVIGVDAAVSSMVEASRRAARATKRGGLPNALFVVAAANALPAELDGLADALTAYFPWGSLLRGLLDADPAIVAGMARVTRPGATATLLLSVTERDRPIDPVSLDERRFAALAPGYAAHGLLLREARLATVSEVARSHSTWAKRLKAGISRPVWLARFHRLGTASRMVPAEPSKGQVLAGGRGALLHGVRQLPGGRARAHRARDGIALPQSTAAAYPRTFGRSSTRSHLPSG